MLIVMRVKAEDFAYNERWMFGMRLNLSNSWSYTRILVRVRQRYSPATVESVQVVRVIGDPDKERICTSIVERQNLTVRMQVRRMTRLTRFQILYVFLVLAHERRRIVHFAVTAHPTAEWTAHQLREAFPWAAARLEPSPHIS
jgi:hypothetical protein